MWSLPINHFFFAEFMTLGLVMLSFMKLVVHQHCMELLRDSIIRHGLLVAQSKGYHLSWFYKRNKWLGALIRAVVCCYTCSGNQEFVLWSVDPCVPCSSVSAGRRSLWLWCVSFAGGESFFRNLPIFVFEHGIWYTTTSFHTSDSTRARAATITPERYTRKYSWNHVISTLHDTEVGILVPWLVFNCRHVFIVILNSSYSEMLWT
jgi:hypothetical protein